MNVTYSATNLTPTVLSRRRTRIVATVGPATSELATLKEAIRAGVDIFRLNFSHGEYALHRVAYQNIRQAANELGETVAILADLCGPKIRVGRFKGGQIEIHSGEQLIVTTQNVMGEPGLIPSQYTDLARDVKPGDRILLDDGLLELRVDTTASDQIFCTVINGGMLKDRKGMNLPGVAVSAPALTDKDKADSYFALGLGVDLIALSFVRSARDVEDLRTLITSFGHSTSIIAKIEKPEALVNLDEILDASDGIMVARGDLGVELPPEAVPIAQQELVIRARRKNRPVIVATQMLESMVGNPRPTRAEVSDVSTAVFSGTDAVMLSAETSVGAHPIRAVQMMDRVARQVESWQWSEGAFRSLTRDEEDPTSPMPLRLAVARATALMSRDLRVRAVVVRTRSGVSATSVAATRPAAPVIALCDDPTVCRRMKLLWGVIPILISDDDFEHPKPVARRVARSLGLAEKDETILLLSGFGNNEPMISVLTI